MSSLLGGKEPSSGYLTIGERRSHWFQGGDTTSTGALRWMQVAFLRVTSSPLRCCWSGLRDGGEARDRPPSAGWRLFLGWAGARQAAGITSPFILVNSLAGLGGNLVSLRSLPT